MSGLQQSFIFGKPLLRLEIGADVRLARRGNFADVMVAERLSDNGFGRQVDGGRCARDDTFDGFARPAANPLDMYGVQPRVFSFNDEDRYCIETNCRFERHDQRLEYFR